MQRYELARPNTEQELYRGACIRRHQLRFFARILLKAVQPIWTSGRFLVSLCSAWRNTHVEASFAMTGLGEAVDIFGIASHQTGFDELLQCIRLARIPSFEAAGIGCKENAELSRG